MQGSLDLILMDERELSSHGFFISELLAYAIMWSLRVWVRKRGICKHIVLLQNKSSPSDITLLHTMFWCALIVSVTLCSCVFGKRIWVVQHVACHIPTYQPSLSGGQTGYHLHKLIYLKQYTLISEFTDLIVDKLSTNYFIPVWKLLATKLRRQFYNQLTGFSDISA